MSLTNSSNVDPLATMHELQAVPPFSDSLSPSNHAQTVAKSSKPTKSLKTPPPCPLRSRPLTFSESQRKMTYEELDADSKEKLTESAYLAYCLNVGVEKDDARRARLGLKPLMPLTFPDDFACTPRVLAYVVDAELKERITEICRKFYGHARISESALIGFGVLAVLRRLSIRLEIESAVRELPVRKEDKFLVLALYFSDDWQQIQHRLTKWRVEKLNEVLGREPEWFILTT